MRGCALLSVTLATASCSWLQSLDKDQTLDWSAEKLYSEARVALDDSNWTQAKDYYQKLEARYPFGQYAQQAQIELFMPHGRMATHRAPCRLPTGSCRLTRTTPTPTT